MILDRRIEIADSLPFAMTVATGNGRFPNSGVIDLGNNPPLALRDLGGGEPLYLVLSVEQSLAGGGGAFIRFQLASSPNSDLSTSRTPHVDTTSLALSFWSIGRTLIYPLPSEVTYRRYLGLWAFVSGADVTGGIMSAFLANQANRFVHYPDAI